MWTRLISPRGASPLSCTLGKIPGGTLFVERETEAGKTWSLQARAVC